MLDARARGVCDRVLTLTGCSEPANRLGLLLAVQRVEVHATPYCPNTIAGFALLIIEDEIGAAVKSTRRRMIRLREQHGLTDSFV
jgi:hypothetical protein